mgnify:FL=1
MPNIGNFCSTLKLPATIASAFQENQKEKTIHQAHRTLVGTIHISISPIIL